MQIGLTLIILSLFFLIGIGFVIIILQALPFLQNKVHEQRIAYLSCLSDEIGAWFHIKMETTDIFAAFNPINISVQTGAVLPEIRSVQLTLEGASSYFEGDYNFSDPDFFSEQYEDFQEALGSNIFHLERNSLTTFAGSIQNVKYTTGGDFDVGITITYEDGGVAGYGMGATDYALKKAIRISPPESLLQVRNNNITLGLAYTAVGLTLIGVGVTVLMDLLIKHFIG